MSETIRIVLVDDHPLFRDGVASTLTREADFEIVGQGETAEDAIALAHDELPDVMLIDISMPGGGIEAARAIASSCPVVKLVMLTVSENEDDVVKALRAGAQGYILKGISGPELVRIVRSVQSGESYLVPDLAVKLLTDFKADSAGPEPQVNPLTQLTAREEQILELVAEALSNKEIGLRLDLSERTVKHYMSNILQKLHVRNRVEAALLAHEITLKPDGGKADGGGG
ncbi:MAG: DNA-binding response regulator [Hyphomicrobiales bacterium]|nr:MAG: DNA-binding response regulator [Hyphomicrobiales bacterium]